MTRGTIKVSLPMELIERLNDIALNRRDIRQPRLSVARDELVERALADMLATWGQAVKPVSRHHPDQGDE
jgi:hypothetical protein